jgi:hypothetical protein
MFGIYSVKRLLAYVLVAITLAVIIGFSTYSFVKLMA